MRALLCDAFAEVCARARTVDWGTLLIRDCGEILMDNLELYR